MKTGRATYSFVKHLLVTFYIIVTVSGCGGGGGGGGDSPAATPPPQPAPPASFTITGGVIAAAGSVTDGDVNDPNAEFIPNNTLPTAQIIPNPASIGGYVNQPGSGPPGRSRIPGDASDLYRVSLVANQQITLTVGDASVPNDLDLFLLDINGNLVASSEGIGNTETIVSLDTGTFIIEAFAFNGASNYVLTVGLVTLAAANTLSVLDDFIPGEAVVRFNDSYNDKARNTKSLSMPESVAGLSTRAGAPGREVLLSSGNSGQLASTAQALNPKTSSKHHPAFMRNSTIDAAKIETIRIIKTLRRRPDIKYAEPNYIIQPLLTPNDGGYPFQWHYPLINLPQAWDITTGSNSVIVAVIDSGVILSHPDLQGQLVPGYDFVSDPANALDGDGIDNNPDDPGNTLQPGTSIFHGTHVAGTIGAASNNTTGVTGVSWAVSIMPLRGLGALGGSSYDVMQAVRYAAGLPNDSGTSPVQRADVINLSLGGLASSLAEQELFAQARAMGVIIVAAAGNSANSTPFYPASYDGVVSVSAVDINKNKTPYSNFGTRVDVAAPGGDGTQDINGDGFPDGVLSTAGDDSSGGIQTNYSFYQGTSMAAPHVAGVVALMKTVNPALTPAAFDNLLASGQLSEDLGQAGRDDVYGYGLIDAHKAVVAAGGTDIAPVLVATPAALNYGTSITAISLAIENGGGGSLTINPPSDNASWLDVAEGNVDINKNGIYVVSVDRTGLGDGTYSATITITSSANTVSVPVVMQVSSTALFSNTGFQYIFLLDAVTGNKVDEVAASVVNGRYSYSFTRVPVGTYRIFSGSDSNNDGFICDAGESCGAFLTLTQPTDIELSEDQSLSDFPSSYAAGFTGQAGTRQSYRWLDEDNAPRQLQR
jgi:serine protease